MKVISIFLFAFLLISSSCSKDVNETLGVYQLKSIEDDCPPDSLFNVQYEILDDNNQCCIKRTLTSIMDGFTLTTESIFCDRIILKESGIALIISDNSTEPDTNQLSYTILDDELEMCVENDICAQYEYANGEITLEIKVQILPPTEVDCFARYTYRK